MAWASSPSSFMGGGGVGSRASGEVAIGARRPGSDVSLDDDPQLGAPQPISSGGERGGVHYGQTVSAPQANSRGGGAGGGSNEKLSAMFGKMKTLFEGAAVKLGKKPQPRDRTKYDEIASKHRNR